MHTIFIMVKLIEFYINLYVSIILFSSMPYGLIFSEEGYTDNLKLLHDLI